MTMKSIAAVLALIARVQASTAPTSVPTSAPTVTPTASPTAAPTLTPGAPTAAPTTVTALTQSISAGTTQIPVADLTGCEPGFDLTFGPPNAETLLIDSCNPSRRLETSESEYDLGRRLVSGPGTVGTNSPTANAQIAGVSITFTTATTTPAPVPACFMSESMVQVAGAAMPMAALQVGDRVGHEEVIGFLHDISGVAAGLTIEHATGELRVSGNHLLLVRGADGATQEKPAETVVIGDALLREGGVPSDVLAVRRDTTTQGMRAPLTKSGAIVVDEVASSVYASISGLPVPHSSIHAAFFPARLLWALTSAGASTSVSKEEMHPLASFYLNTLRADVFVKIFS